MPRIEQIRRRKHERRLRRAALALAVLVAVFLYLGGVFSASVNLFSDLLDSARIALTPGGGWPVGMQVEGLLYAEPLSGGLVLCGKSELVLYSPTARQLRSVQHGYAEPALAVGNAGSACITAAAKSCGGIPQPHPHHQEHRIPHPHRGHGAGRHHGGRHPLRALPGRAHGL